MHAMAGSPPKFPPPPPPFPSHPSAAELIESYLRPRIACGAKVGEFIHHADLYTAAPGDLTGQFRPVTAGDGREAWYFFTKRNFRSVFKVAVDCAVPAGEGRWEQEGPPQPVLSSLGGRPARAQQQTFAFMRKEGAREVRSGWSMVELCLDPSDEFVMCKVYRSPSDDPEAIDAAAEAEIREAGDKDPGAETAAAASPERQKKAVAGEGAGAAATRRAPLDAADKGTAIAEPEDEVEDPAPAVYTMDSFPSEQVLINSYLRPWADSKKKADDEFIHEADVYSDAPDDLVRLFKPAAAADRGEEAWYFLTTLRFMGMNVMRRVDSGKGAWRNSNQLRPVLSDDGSGIGLIQTFTFARKEAKKQLHLGWKMVELRLDRSGPNALCKVYRSPRAPGSKEADDEASSAVGMAAHGGEEDGEEIDSAAAAEAAAAGPGLKRKADDEASSAVGVAAHGREEDGEEIDSAAAAEAAAAGPGLKRKAGDKGSGAETAAESPGSQKKAVGESAGAAATGELCVDRRASLDDAAEEVEAPAEAEPEDPNDPTKPKLHMFF